MSGGGYLLIISEDEESENEDQGRGHHKQKLDEPKEHKYKRVEATIVANFCKKELNQLAQEFHCLVNREPSIGQAEELTIKQTRTEDEARVNGCLKEIGSKSSSIQRQDVGFEESDSKKVQDYVDEDPVDVQFYVNKNERTVTVLGKSNESLQKQVHALKVYLGQLTPNSRAQRQLVTESTRTTSYTNKAERSRVPSPPSSRSNHWSSPPPSSRTNHWSSTHGSDEPFSFEHRFNKNFVLKVYKESITRARVDVIVNAANDNLKHGGGVARVISRAAGYDFDRESDQYIQRYGLISVTKSCETSAGKLPFISCIHAVGPQWVNYNDKEQCVQDVYETVLNVLKRCEMKKYASVGIPAISAGIYGVPKTLCADVYVKAAADFSDRKPFYLQEMHLIDVDLEILKLVQESFYKWRNSPEKIDPKYTVPAYLKLHGGQRSYQGLGQGQSNRRNREFTRQTSVEGNLGDRSRYACSVVENEKEKFRWGGEADVFLVGGAITVKIFQSEIDKVRNLDALVCGIDKRLTSFGFVAKALETAGGAKYKTGLEDMTRKINSREVKINDVFKSKPGNLGVKHVVHLVNERVTGAWPDEVKSYREGINQVLVKAKSWKISTLALPMIGTGTIQIDRVKLGKCCSALLQAVCDFCATESEPSVTELHLINNKWDVCSTLVGVFRQACDTSNKTKHSRSPAESPVRRTGSPAGGAKRTASSPDRGQHKYRAGNDGKEYSKPSHRGNHRHGNSSSYEGERSGNSGRSRSPESRVDIFHKKPGNFKSERKTYTAKGRVESDSDRKEEDMEIGNESNDNESDDEAKKPASPKTPPQKGNLLIFED